MLSEELKDQILNTKLNFLNGYLMALGFLNSYSVVGYRGKLFAFNFSAGNIEKCVQDNAYELFGVYPNDWNIEIRKNDDWETKLKSELNASLTRRIPHKGNELLTKQLDYSKNNLVDDLNYRVKFSNEYFVSILKSEFITDKTDVYELIVKDVGASYRIVGIDLIFEIESTKLLFLQLIGND
ncbi:hypothetical protein A3860_33455 [Niastella vici]|uniref:Uncharacterized protein n=1 Tax=Niastella vici TaxID=1703345 RepID=A0A1V9FPZ5_9BACT|nr:hypothetical protein [Niastella vici]OQP60433.1 hypothetical protein A3860_33455 [Niastella vici]